MKDYSFLNHFITENIYLIDQVTTSQVESSTAEAYLIVTTLPLSDKDKEFIYKIFAAVDVFPDLLDFGGPETKFKDGHSKVFFLEPNLLKQLTSIER